MLHVTRAALHSRAATKCGSLGVGAYRRDLRKMLPCRFLFRFTVATWKATMAPIPTWNPRRELYYFDHISFQEETFLSLSFLTLHRTMKHLHLYLGAKRCFHKKSWKMHLCVYCCERNLPVGLVSILTILYRGWEPPYVKQFDNQQRVHVLLHFLLLHIRTKSLFYTNTLFYITYFCCTTHNLLHT